MQFKAVLSLICFVDIGVGIYVEHSHQIADWLNPLVNYNFSDMEQPSKPIATDGSASLW